MSAPQTFQIMPMDMSHVEGFWNVLDIVAREKLWLGSTQAQPIEELRTSVAHNITLKNAQFVALVNAKVVGWCDIIRETKLSKMHRGVVGMGVHPEFRGMGIGHKLLEQSMVQAEEQGIGRIELSVYTHNTSAKNLYDRHGFKTEGILRMNRFIGEKYFDTFEMVRLNENLLQKHAAANLI
jgi:ribosomal protein S18 acetylase RimI-like enzyme